MKKRRAFFSEPFLQHLWKLFVGLKPDVLIQHLRRTRSFPNEGEARYKMLLEDIQVTEKLCNFKIIPDNALGDHVITRLTPSEFDQDLDEVGKFNKRSTEALRSELDRQNRLIRASESDSHSTDAHTEGGHFHSDDVASVDNSVPQQVMTSQTGSDHDEFSE